MSKKSSLYEFEENCLYQLVREEYTFYSKDMESISCFKNDFFIYTNERKKYSPSHNSWHYLIFNFWSLKHNCILQLIEYSDVHVCRIKYPLKLLQYKRNEK